MHEIRKWARPWAARLFCLVALGVAVALPPMARADGSPRVVVFAAASLAEAVEALVARFTRSTGIQVVPAFAASSALARQIDHGAPADVFISANARWMDYLAARGRIDAQSRCDLLRNRLVLIVPAESRLAVRIAPGFALAAALDGGRLALGDPDHVPAGLYARQALAALGVWPAAESLLVRSADVRAALALVARGEAAAGVVSATDAAVSDRVRIVGTFPPASHDPIVYPVALVNGSGNAAARAFFEFLRSPEGLAVLAGFGFETNTGISCSS